MASGRIVARLGLAALASGGTAGLLLTLAVFFGGLLSGYARSWWTASALLDWLPIGFLAGLFAASLPAFFAGAGLWSIGDTVRAVRHPLAWAASGAVIGGALWALYLLGLGSVGENGLDTGEMALLAAGLVAGCGGALAFLAVMRLSGLPRRQRR
jgi:hypothetical protein